MKIIETLVIFRKREMERARCASLRDVSVEEGEFEDLKWFFRDSSLRLYMPHHPDSIPTDREREKEMLLLTYRDLEYLESASSSCRTAFKFNRARHAYPSTYVGERERERERESVSLGMLSCILCITSMREHCESSAL